MMIAGVVDGEVYDSRGLGGGTSGCTGVRWPLGF